MTKKKKEELEVTYGGPDGTYKIEDWVPSDGFQYAGGNVTTATVDSFDPSFNITYGDIGTADMFEEELKKKYPALQDAWEHYQNIKRMCETREKEEDGS